jgi:hypothetical protein
MLAPTESAIRSLEMTSTTSAGRPRLPLLTTIAMTASRRVIRWTTSNMMSLSRAMVKFSCMTSTRRMSL